MKEKSIALIVTIFLIFSSFTIYAVAEDDSTVIIFTNDVHCATEDYPILAAYRENLISNGSNVILVDAGDAIQGEMIGSLTEGSAIANIMNNVGYDFAVPGNHEFDYNFNTFLNIVENEAKYEYLCSNLVDLRSGKTVLKPYTIKEIGGIKYGFIGISTPETYSKAAISYFQDENGNLIYSFSENDFYQTVQNAIDGAKSEGAEYIIAIGHLGISGITEGWRSTDLIANTSGINYFIDGHSHEIIEKNIVNDKNGNSVLLSSTGTKLNYFGTITIQDGNIKTELIDPKTVQLDSLSSSAKESYEKVKEVVDGYNNEFEFLFEEIGESEVRLAINDENGKRIVRFDETNAANFVTDAYKAITNADIAFVNGGGVRSEIPIGKFTRKAIMDINPWGNEICVIEVTSKQLLDALEYGMHATPQEFGSFPHTAGVTFEVHTYIPTPVTVDMKDNCIAIDENAERRVKNVKVGGNDLDLNAKYTIAGSVYMLKQSGYTMFANAKTVNTSPLPTDSEILIDYVTNYLNGKITKDKYGNIYGDGRIVMVTEPKAEEPIVPGDEESILFFLIIATVSVFVFSAVKARK